MITSVATTERNDSSWLTISNVCGQSGLDVMYSCSHTTPARSKWFVGSSSRRMSGLDRSAAARRMRMRQPPLSFAAGSASCASLKPNPRNTSSVWTRDVGPVSSSSSKSMSPSRCGT
jgi:hypothetical protein